MDAGLPDAIKEAARAQGLTLEALRKRARLANGTFYNLLRGRPPGVVRTLKKLKKVHVRHPLVDAA